MEKILEKVTFAKLFRDLSYEGFFDTYNPHRDGRVVISTYSFEHKHLNFWAKFEPFSIIYVSDKYKDVAKLFVKRFPFFLVFSVPNLHTKAFFFLRSCRLLMGSQNLYAPKSSFYELMCELWLEEKEKEDVLNLIFDFPKSEFIKCEYALSDLKIHINDAIYYDGRPFLPCHKETTYWNLVANIISFDDNLKPPKHEFDTPGFIYVVLEYRVGNDSCYLAFDRGYCYSGDINKELFSWLLQNVEHVIQEETFIYPGEIGAQSPLKDSFVFYHPIAKDHIAIRSYFFEKVIDRDKNRNILERVTSKDITDKKLRKKDALFFK